MVHGGVLIDTVTFEELADDASSNDTFRMPDQCDKMLGIQFDPTIDTRITLKSSNSNVTICEGITTNQGAGAPYLWFDLPRVSDDDYRITLINKSGSTLESYAVSMIFKLKEERRQNYSRM
jgi:hypothetical protein